MNSERLVRKLLGELGGGWCSENAVAGGGFAVDEMCCRGLDGREV